MAQGLPLGYAYSYLNQTTTPVTVKAGAGILHAITVNNIGTNMTITIADATSVTSPAIAITGTITTLGTLFYDVSFNTGLTITLGGTPGNITVCYQ